MAKHPLCTGHTVSAPAPRTSSSSSCFQRPHVGWQAVRIGTAKCDMCSKQSRGVVQRCCVCALCVCRPCVQQGALLDNKSHFLKLDDSTVDWQPAKTKRRRSKVKKRTMASAVIPNKAESALMELEEEAARILVRMPTLGNAAHTRTYESAETPISQRPAHHVQTQITDGLLYTLDQQRQVIEPTTQQVLYPAAQENQEGQAPAYTYAQNTYPDPGVYLDHQQHCSYYYAPQSQPYFHTNGQKLPRSPYDRGAIRGTST